MKFFLFYPALEKKEEEKKDGIYHHSIKNRQHNLKLKQVYLKTSEFLCSCRHQKMVEKFDRKLRSVSKNPALIMCFFPKDILINQVWKIKFDELDFQSISNLIFTACVPCKNPVQNRQKIKFKNQFREIEISKNRLQIDRRRAN